MASFADAPLMMDSRAEEVRLGEAGDQQGMGPGYQTGHQLYFYFLMSVYCRAVSIPIKITCR